MDSLSQIRKKIDLTDNKLIALLKKRRDLVGKIGKIKTAHKQLITDKDREREILARLDEDFLINIFKTIIRESKKLQ